MLVSRLRGRSHVQFVCLTKIDNIFVMQLLFTFSYLSVAYSHIDLVRQSLIVSFSSIMLLIRKNELLNFTAGQLLRSIQRHPIYLRNTDPVKKNAVEKLQSTH